MDVFGYIAYGDNKLYHLGALLSALKLLHHCPSAKIIIATDKPELFHGYPFEITPITSEQKDRMSFNQRYNFGIKAGFLIELLKQSDRLLFMDTDMYPTGDTSKGFLRISRTHSFMRLCEGPHVTYQANLPGKNIKIGTYVLTGQEPMWNSGILGVHRNNLGALVDAFAAMEAVYEATNTYAPEQFCIGVALSQSGRTISPHRLPVRHYNTRGKKLFAEPRVHQFFSAHGAEPIPQQIAEAGQYRLWRTPADLWRQRRRWSL